MKKENIGRFSKLSSDGVLQQAFALSSLQSGIVALEDGGAVVIQVLSIMPGNSDDLSSKEIAMYQHMLDSEWSTAIMMVMGNEIVSAAKVKRNNQVLSSI